MLMKTCSSNTATVVEYLYMLVSVLCVRFRAPLAPIFSSLLLSFRLVLSRFEFDTLTVGETTVESEEDVEEVWLFWKENGKEIRSKSIRELAQDAKEGQKEDQEVVSYYR